MGPVDVIGNVWEWVDGRMSPSSDEVVIRGCGCDDGALFCRAASRVDGAPSRVDGAPSARGDVLGFRPARSAFP